MSDSPCVRNCCLDQQNCCLGCGRVLDEIIEWHSASPQRRQQIRQQASERLAKQHSAAMLRHPVVTPSE